MEKINLRRRCDCGGKLITVIFTVKVLLAKCEKCGKHHFFKFH